MEPKWSQKGGKMEGKLMENRVQVDVRRDSRKHRFLRALPHGRPGFAHVDFSGFLLIFNT